MDANFAWPGGRRAALSLTYDDALDCHHEVAAPALEGAGLRGTFYVTGMPLLADPAPWRGLADRGHELGNHSLFHPCREDIPGSRPWLAPAYNLAGYDATRWRDEMEAANRVLRLVDGRAERTFGNTCYENYIGPAGAKLCLEPMMDGLFAAARGEESQRIITPANLNLANLGCFGCEGRDFPALRGLAERAREAGGWAILVFHGIGAGTHGLWNSVESHAALAEWLGKAGDIWTAPVLDVVRHLKAAGR